MATMCDRKRKMVSRNAGSVADVVKCYQHCICVCSEADYQCGSSRSANGILDFYHTVSWNITVSDFVFGGKSFCQ